MAAVQRCPAQLIAVRMNANWHGLTSNDPRVVPDLDEHLSDDPRLFHRAQDRTRDAARLPHQFHRLPDRDLAGRGEGLAERLRGR